ncbi:MAG: aldehyde dehydrogenase family protein, partial [Firmicutes bacterium]|nr:aldehyde dehydrogenase family protein [Bacillota bacterium]
MTIEQILAAQKVYFHTGATLPVKFRIENLNKLYAAIQKYEKEIAAALKSDLGKSEYESFMCEIGLTLTEATYMIKHTKKLAKKRRVATPLAQFASCSYQQPSPYGNTLIMSPWNYPFLLTMESLIDA